MLKANIATAKNELSRLLRHVKRGERVIITERNHPIAQLQPFVASEHDPASSALAPLYEAGVLTPPKQNGFDIDAFLAMPAPSLPKDQSLAQAVLDERAESQ